MEASAVNPEPSIGRIVHYVEVVGADVKIHRPAVVLEVSEDNPSVACLKVMTPGGDHVVSAAPVAAPSDAKGGTWHWPERV